MKELLTPIAQLAQRASHADDGKESIKYAAAAKILTEAWGLSREIMIHERYHNMQEKDVHTFGLPGEEPLKGHN